MTKHENSEHNEVSITAILSSPRQQSNSRLLAEEIIRGAKEKGARIKTFDLNKIRIKPCTACYACKEKSNGCIIQDGMQEIYSELKASRVWIMATPIYWFSVSAQLKIFIDRFFALYNQNKIKCHLKGRKFAAAFTYGCEDAFESGCGNAIRMFQDIAAYTGAEFAGYVHGCGEISDERDPEQDGYLVPGTVADNQYLIAKAYQLGQRLVQ